MRFSQQYSAAWSQFDESHRAIDVTKTKNATAQTIPPNADALVAIKSVRRSGQKPTDRILPPRGSEGAIQPETAEVRYSVLVSTLFG